MSEDTPKFRSRNLLRPAIGLLAIVAVFLITQYIRTSLGIQWSPQSIRSTVERLGLLAPLGFLALVMLRQFMALPSILVLTSAGLLFGAPLGTLIGGLGLSLNALVLFGTARTMGRDWVLPRLEARYPNFEERTRATGPMLVALMTGHPLGTLTPFHFAAGVTRMSIPVFVLAVLPAALFRAGCYSFLGANLMQPGSPRFWIAAGVLLLVSLLPLAHPGLRARILRRS